MHWQRGDIALLDHDLQGERALVGLGGDVPMCLIVHDFLTGRLGTSTGAAEQVIAHHAARQATRRMATSSVASKLARPLSLPAAPWPLATALTQQAKQFSAHIASMRPSRRGPLLVQRARWLGSVLSPYLPPALESARLRAADVAVIRLSTRRLPNALPEHVRLEMARRRLVNAARSAMDEAVQAAHPLAWSSDAHILHVTEVSPGEDPGFEAELDRHGGHACAKLGLRWLNSVHRRGLDIVDGTFVVEAGTVGAERVVDVRAVRWRRVGAGRLVAHVAAGLASRVDDHWHIAWLDSDDAAPL